MWGRSRKCTVYRKASLRSKLGTPKRMVRGEVDRFFALQWLIKRIGFGRKMYTDYEIVCKVRFPLSSRFFHFTYLISWRLTSRPLNFVTPSYADATLTSRLSAISSSANPLELIYHPFLERSPRIGSQTRLLREEERD